MNTKEKNKMIAEYMGVKMGEPFQWRIGATVPLEESHLLYHFSWGWIIPVAKKLREELKVLADRIPGAESYEESKRQFHSTTAMICLRLLETSGGLFEITPLYNAVCSAIEFLNKQKEG